MTYRVVLLSLLAACLCTGVGCQFHPRPADAPGDVLPVLPPSTQPYQISHMHIKSVRPEAFLYRSVRTSFDELADPASRTIADLKQLLAAGKIHSGGQILFVYHDPTEDPSASFDLEIGIPNPSPAQPSDDFKIRTLPAFRCATIVYRGPLTLLKHAYDKLIPEMIAAGFIPSDQTRETYLVWEGPESPNNVVQIEVGIQ